MYSPLAGTEPIGQGIEEDRNKDVRVMDHGRDKDAIIN